MKFAVLWWATSAQKTMTWTEWLDKNPLWVVFALAILLFLLAQAIRPFLAQGEQPEPKAKTEIPIVPVAEKTKPPLLAPKDKQVSAEPTQQTVTPKPSKPTQELRKKAPVVPAKAEPVAEPVAKPVAKPVAETPPTSEVETTPVVAETKQKQAEPSPVTEPKKPKPEPVAEKKPEPKPEPVAEKKPEPKPEPVAEKKPEPKPEPVVEKKPEPKPEPVVEKKPEPVVEKKPEPKPEPVVEKKPEPKPEPVVEKKPEPVAAKPVVKPPVAEEESEEERRKKRSDELKEKRRMTVDDLELEEEVVQIRTLREGLEKTRKGWLARLNDLVRGKKELGDDLLEELEEVLYTADIGTRTTAQLLRVIEEKMERKELKSPELVKEAIKDEIYRILTVGGEDLNFEKEKPYVVMVVGVNGVGKTTTIGKLAARLSYEGKQVMVAAADTFRAAAVEQLEQWASRVNAQVIKGQANQDPSSVVFDAVQAGVSREADVVLADTAGRLHTKQNLMEELKKVKRVMGRAMATAPHEVWLVLDATTGQNAVTQAKQFHEALGVTGIILTKLDGTAKGGVVVAIAEELKIPIRYIGVGEHIDELRRFSAAEFVDALF